MKDIVIVRENSENALIANAVGEYKPKAYYSDELQLITREQLNAGEYNVVANENEKNAELGMYDYDLYGENGAPIKARYLMETTPGEMDKTDNAVSLDSEGMELLGKVEQAYNMAGLQEKYNAESKMTIAASSCSGRIIYYTALINLVLGKKRKISIYNKYMDKPLLYVLNGKVYKAVELGDLSNIDVSELVSAINSVKDVL